MIDMQIRARPVRDTGGGRLADIFPAGVITLGSPGTAAQIEKRARITQRAGPQPLWEGYVGTAVHERLAEDPFRTSNQVRTRPKTGAVFDTLVRTLAPEIIVEFGTAFGVSGMYFLAALRENGRGVLYTFEPNPTWRDLALRNLGAISDQFVSTLGTFEENCDKVLPADHPIDIALVDAIHTPEFVYPQVEILKRRMRSGGVLILDDIPYSPAMEACWEDLAHRDDVALSMRLGSRVGLIELA